MKIALVTFADPHLLPPIRNTAVVLRARGWQVDVLGIRWADRAPSDAGFPDDVRVELPWSVAAGVGWHLRYAQFALWASACARRERYDWIIAYDLPAAPIGQLMAMACGARWAYHNLDLVAAPQDMSRSLRVLGYKWRELAAARHADLIVFPQRERAALFMRQAKISRQPLIAYNCPTLAWPDADATVDPRVAALRAVYPRLVVYQGGLSLSRGLGALVESMPHWRADASLVLVGETRGSRDVAAMQQRVAALGLERRVLWLGALDYAALPGVTRQAALGVLLTPPVPGGLRVELAHLAGASNKVFEYMSVGLPVLVPATPGFATLIEAPRLGECCRELAPRALGAQISRLLDDEEGPREMGARARRAFEAELHYEHQLRDVLRVIEA